jgi:hypothetical protein
MTVDKIDERYRQPKNAWYLSLLCCLIACLEKFWKHARGVHMRVYFVYYYDKVGKIFNGNVLQRLLKYEYFTNYKQYKQ